MVTVALRSSQSHNLAATDHHGPFAGNFHPRLVQHPDDAFRGTRNRAGLFHPQRRHVQRMESVHVFFFVDGGNDAVFVDVIRQRQLHQDAVHALIGIQVSNQRQQFLFGNGSRTQDRGILDSHDLAGLTLAPPPFRPSFWPRVLFH